MEEPYRLTLDQISELTEAQIVEVFARPRDAKTGQPKRVGVKPKRAYTSPEEAKASFLGLMTALGGMTPDAAEAAWQRAQEKRG